jgi:hypothetical protein
LQPQLASQQDLRHFLRPPNNLLRKQLRFFLQQLEAEPQLASQQSSPQQSSPQQPSSAQPQLASQQSSPQQPSSQPQLASQQELQPLLRLNSLPRKQLRFFLQQFEEHPQLASQQSSAQPQLASQHESPQ